MKIMFVDDEKSNTILFKKSMPGEFAVHTFTDPIEASENLMKVSPHVIVSDEDMPKLKGIDLLKSSMDLLPKSLRIIVTGKTDIDVLQKQTEPNVVHFFIGKPYDPNFIISRINAYFGENSELKPASVRSADEAGNENVRLAFNNTNEKFKKHRDLTELANQTKSELEDKTADLFMQLGSAIKYDNFKTLLKMSLDEGHNYEQFLEVYWRFNSIKKGLE